MSLDYDILAEGLRTWVKTASQLPDERVLLSFGRYQGQPRPAGGPFITISMTSLVTTGIPGTTETYYAEAAVGQEIEQRTLDLGTLNVRLQAYGGGVAGNTSALALLTRVRGQLALPLVRDALHAAGAAPFDPGAVLWVPGIEGTKFEGRAVLDVAFHVDASEAARTGYITQVEVTDKGVTPNRKYTVDAEDA